MMSPLESSQNTILSHQSMLVQHFNPKVVDHLQSHPNDGSWVGVHLRATPSLKQLSWNDVTVELCLSPKLPLKSQTLSSTHSPIGCQNGGSYHNWLSHLAFHLGLLLMDFIVHGLLSILLHRCLLLAMYFFHFMNWELQLSGIWYFQLSYLT